MAGVTWAVNAEAAPKDKPDKPPKDEPSVTIVPELPKGQDKGNGRFIPFQIQAAPLCFWGLLFWR